MSLMRSSSKRGGADPATPNERERGRAADAQRAWRRLGVVLGVVLNVVLSVMLALPRAGADEAELTAPVRTLDSPPAAPPDAMPQRPNVPPRALLRGVLPQYQVTRAFRSDAGAAPSSDNPTMRFFLAVPDQLLLFEAHVTIDGRGYTALRERRIDRLLEELKQPAAPARSPAPSETVRSPRPPSEDGTPFAAPVELRPVPSDALEERLRRYAAVTGRAPSREEVRWLLTKWVDGPTLLMLDANFQRSRGLQAPAYHVLDRDLDGVISAEELKDAAKTLRSCDVNQNDVVEYAEIAEVANRPRRDAAPSPAPSLTPILDPASTAREFQRLAKRFAPPQVARFDLDGDGQLNAAEYEALAQLTPDVVFTVAFQTIESGHSTTRISHLAAPLQGAARSLGESISIPVGPAAVEFSAVQSAALSDADQLSVGIVNDGYPLLPALDPNEDGRLTIRELRQVVEQLQQFDSNGDGAITPDEIPSTVRVAIGLGPCVHQHLAGLRAIRPPSTAAKVSAPNWFVSMDRNKDGDVSPREFLLGPEKFKELDVDEDGLISPAEAARMKAGRSQAAPQPSAPKRDEAKATP